MRKYIIALASVIFLLAAAACSQGPDDHSGPDVTKVETAEDLVLFLADSGPGIADVNLAISPDDEYLREVKCLWNWLRCMNSGSR